MAQKASTEVTNVNIGILDALAQRTLADYAAAVDQRDAQALERLVVDDVGLTRAGSTQYGAGPFMEFYRSVFEAPAIGSRHMVSNVRAEELEDGSVGVRAYFEAVFIETAATRRILGRYDDTMVFADGLLKIAHKRNIIDWIIEGSAAR
jgi:hypothetical protein